MQVTMTNEQCCTNNHLITTKNPQGGYMKTLYIPVIRKPNRIIMQNNNSTLLHHPRNFSTTSRIPIQTPPLFASKALAVERTLSTGLCSRTCSAENHVPCKP